MSYEFETTYEYTATVIFQFPHLPIYQFTNYLIRLIVQK